MESGNAEDKNKRDFASFDEHIRAVVHKEAEILLADIIKQEANSAVNLRMEAMQVEMREHLNDMTKEISKNSFNNANEVATKIMNEQLKAFEEQLNLEAQYRVTTIASEKISNLEALLSSIERSEDKFIRTNAISMAKLRKQIGDYKSKIPKEKEKEKSVENQGIDQSSMNKKEA